MASSGGRAMITDTDRIPAWMIAVKVLLVGLLVTGALFSDVGGFAGKGMAYRLPIFLLPALIVPVRWWRHRGAYDIGLDVALTVPFLFDTLGNAVGFYDRFARTDDVLHFVNWFVLVGGIAWSLRVRLSVAPAPDWLVVLAGAGIGAMAAIAWEVAEYAVMRAGVGNLSLTYPDTLSDLVLGTTGGVLGAWLSLRLLHRRAS